MRTTNIAELKNNLSNFLADVKLGQEILISDRNKPFAKIIPLHNTSDFSAEELALAAAGILRLPEESEIGKSFLKEKRSKVVRELVESGKKHKAVELYRQKKVSMGLGAKLAGVNLSEFIDLLKEQNVYLNLEMEDVDKAIGTARKVL